MSTDVLKALEVNLKYQGKRYIECPFCGIIMALFSESKTSTYKIININLKDHKFKARKCPGCKNVLDVEDLLIRE